jgi:hypothetical protein
MTVEYLHASKFGNGATVAAEFKRRMTAEGAAVEVQARRHAAWNRLRTFERSRGSFVTGCPKTRSSSSVTRRTTPVARAPRSGDPRVGRRGSLVAISAP